jgi:hypothetical protein
VPARAARREDNDYEGEEEEKKKKCPTSLKAISLLWDV